MRSTERILSVSFRNLRAMAGTLIYRLRVQHIFQQRFVDAAALGTALQDCRWYIITRRPAVRIVPDSVALDDDILTLDVRTRRPDGSPHTVNLGADIIGLGRTHSFDTHPDGSYFSFRSGDQLLHGDAWALASLLSDALPDLARQEVLYVGHAFDQTTWARTNRHETLQRIYAEHVGTDWDIFVAPLAVDRRIWTADDHIDDDEEGAGMEGYYGTFATMGGDILKPAVDIVEHSLVSYFVPEYNDKLTEWRVSSPTRAMRQMRDGGFRLLHVHLDGWAGLARFYSQQAPEFHRSHFISQDIPPEPRRPVLRGISAAKLSTWRPDALAVRYGKEIFASRAECSGTALRIFGDQAPAVRAPADFLATATSIPSASGRTPQAHRAPTSLRQQLLAERAERQRQEEPIPHPGGSSYNSTTGTVCVGVLGRENTTEWLWQLHTPTGAVEHGLILGDPGRHKSNLLRVVMREAAASEAFFVVPADPHNEHDFPTKCAWIAPDSTWISTNVADTVSNLDRLSQYIAHQRDRSAYTTPTPQTPGLLCTIDDADDVLRDPHGAACAKWILQAGSQAGVGLVVILGDRNTLAMDPELARLLLRARNVVVAMGDGDAVLADLHATYGEPRTHTSSGAAATFVLHWNPAQMILGVMTAITDPTLTPDEAKSWSESRLDIGDDESSDWYTVDGDARSWWMFDARSIERWFLRRHADCWALVRVLSNYPMPHTPSQLAAIAWANYQIRQRFHTRCGQWQSGPTTGEPGLVALYADTQDEPIAKPRPNTLDVITQMY